MRILLRPWPVSECFKAVEIPHPTDSSSVITIIETNDRGIFERSKSLGFLESGRKSNGIVLAKKGSLEKNHWLSIDENLTFYVKLPSDINPQISSRAFLNRVVEFVGSLKKDKPELYNIFIGNRWSNANSLLKEQSFGKCSAEFWRAAIGLTALKYSSREAFLFESEEAWSILSRHLGRDAPIPTIDDLAAEIRAESESCQMLAAGDNIKYLDESGGVKDGELADNVYLGDSEAKVFPKESRWIEGTPLVSQLNVSLSKVKSVNEQDQYTHECGLERVPRHLVQEYILEKVDKMLGFGVAGIQITDSLPASAVGSYNRQLNLIKLSENCVNEGTIGHECFHAAQESIFSAQELKVLDRQFSPGGACYQELKNLVPSCILRKIESSPREAEAYAFQYYIDGQFTFKYDFDDTKSLFEKIFNGIKKIIGVSDSISSNQNQSGDYNSVKNLFKDFRGGRYAESLNSELGRASQDQKKSLAGEFDTMITA